MRICEKKFSLNANPVVYDFFTINAPASGLSRLIYIPQIRNRSKLFL